MQSISVSPTEPPDHVDSVTAGSICNTVNVIMQTSDREDEQHRAASVSACSMISRNARRFTMQNGERGDANQ